MNPQVQRQGIFSRWRVTTRNSFCVWRNPANCGCSSLGKGAPFFTGEDLFGKLFSAKGRVKRLALGTDSESLSGEPEDFLQALCQSPAIPKSEIPQEIPREMVLELTDGVSLPLELYSDGYVVLSGLWEVGFQMEKTDFSPWFQQIPPVE